MTVPFDRLAAAVAGRYRIERELGQGGRATVYLAEDLKHKRSVATKVLQPELAAVLGAERFIQETTADLQRLPDRTIELYAPETYATSDIDLVVEGRPRTRIDYRLSASGPGTAERRNLEGGPSGRDAEESARCRPAA